MQYADEWFAHPGDTPDLVITHDNIALIIEHFEFDSYRVTRKGNCSRTEQARIDRKFNEQPIGSVYMDRIRGASSYDDYVANATRSFTTHYKLICMYKDNLTKDGVIKDTTIVKTMFLIEDVSPIGTMVFSEDSESGIAPVILAHSPEFFELVAQSPNIDYILINRLLHDSLNSCLHAQHMRNTDYESTQSPYFSIQMNYIS